MKNCELKKLYEFRIVTTFAEQSTKICMELLKIKLN